MKTFFILYLGCTLLKSSNWAFSYFGLSAFEQIIFHLKVPLEGTNKQFIFDWIKDCLLFSILPSCILFFFLYLSHLESFAVYILCLCCFFGLINIEFFQYIYHQFSKTNLYQKEFVPFHKSICTRNTKQKKNLIHIYLESMETTYATKESGGNSTDELLPYLTKLTKENINFSNTNKIGGAKVVVGTGWTTGGMVASQAGIPLLFGLDHKFCKDGVPFSPGVTGLSDILNEEGYNQCLMIGSDAKFGGRYAYFKEHGNVDIQDIKALKKENKIPSDYHVFWGFEDDKLFSLAKDKISDLSKEKKPFCFTMLTVDMHHPYGFQSKQCKNKFSDPLSNSIYHTDSLLKDFIEWLKRQDFYKDTVIVIQGDHISMAAKYINKVYDKKYDRRVWNVFINSQAKPVTTKNREFTSMDMFPTILSALGYKLNNSKLGLGTDLFSGKQTLLEKYGFKKLNNELAKNDSFYKEKILNIKKRS